MDKLFLASNHMEYSYNDLLHAINSKLRYSRYIYVKGNDPYQIFVQVIHSILYQYPVELLDGDFSDYELELLGLNLKLVTEDHLLDNTKSCHDMTEIIQLIRQNKNWTISLYTSGTTGRPKKVTHTLETIARNVKVNDNFRGSIWAFCYNPTHIAGLQVFLQALFNMNSIVYAFGDRQDDLEKLIQQYHITNISATSTYYRMVLSHFQEQHKGVRYVTFGGEKYDPQFQKTVIHFFPNAKVRNIYASTEGGSLLTSSGDMFQIEEQMSSLIKVNESQELCLHRSLIGQSEHLQLQGEWYQTGDLVEKVSDMSFRIISRRSEMINVGGYNVNPTEVEAILNQVPGVIDIAVTGRANKLTGNIIVAEVVKEAGIDEKELTKMIKAYASEHLQSWKTPRIITFVDEIVKTRTGKKGRSCSG
jgi:acyl-coenzyme A synthetase/AMP-(fatty) acid ligase